MLGALTDVDAALLTVAEPDAVTPVDKRVAVEELAAAAAVVPPVVSAVVVVMLDLLAVLRVTVDGRVVTVVAMDDV